MPTWLGFEILWKLRSIWITFFLPEGLFEAFIGSKTFFQSTFLFQIRKTHIWCNVSCNVWLCMNETFEYLNLFFIQIYFIPLFKIYYPSLPMRSLYGLALLICYASVLFSEKYFFLRTSYRITTCLKLGVRMLWFFDSFIVGKQIDFFMLDFSIDFHVVNKFNINNENLPKQCTYSIHVNKIKCILHPKKASI